MPTVNQEAFVLSNNAFPNTLIQTNPDEFGSALINKIDAADIADFQAPQLAEISSFTVAPQITLTPYIPQPFDIPLELIEQLNKFKIEHNKSLISKYGKENHFSPEMISEVQDSYQKLLDKKYIAKNYTLKSKDIEKLFAYSSSDTPEYMRDVALYTYFMVDSIFEEMYKATRKKNEKSILDFGKTNNFDTEVIDKVNEMYTKSIDNGTIDKGHFLTEKELVPMFNKASISDYGLKNNFDTEMISEVQDYYQNQLDNKAIGKDYSLTIKDIDFYFLIIKTLKLIMRIDKPLQKMDEPNP